MRLSTAILVLLPLCHAWTTRWIAPIGWGLSNMLCRRPGWSIAAAAVHAGEAVVCVPDVVRADELERLVSISTTLAAEKRAAGSDGVRDVDGSTGVRMHVPALLPTEAALCDTILQRMLRFVDAELPALGPYLFGTATSELSLCALHESGDLTFSANEPAVNVYYEGGSFSPHKDYCASAGGRTQGPSACRPC